MSFEIFFAKKKIRIFLTQKSRFSPKFFHKNKAKWCLKKAVKGLVRHQNPPNMCRNGSQRIFGKKFFLCDFGLFSWKVHLPYFGQKRFWRKNTKSNTSRHRALSRLLLYNFVVPSSTSKWPSESFLRFFLFEIWSLKVEILAFFFDLKKSYFHKKSLSSTSHLNVQKRLLLLSDAAGTFFTSIAVNINR